MTDNPIDLLLSYILKKIPAILVKGTVVSVNKTESTCVVQPLNEADAPITDVQFRAVITDDNTQGVIFVPKVNSAVTVGFIHNDSSDALIVQFSDIEEMWIKKGSHIFSMNDGIFINTTDKAQKALLGPPTKQVLDTDIQRLNAVYTLLTSPIFLAGIIAIPGDGGTTFTTNINSILNAAPVAPTTTNILSSKTYLE